MLTYLGYTIDALTLQNSPPAELMRTTVDGGVSPTPGAVLAARFFAPKITDISSENTPVRTVGWRKLVRLIPPDTSIAHRNGIDSAFILFNFFSPITATNPFDEHADSVNTQIALVSLRTDRAPIYWLDFGPTSTGATRSNALDAFFDAGHTPLHAGRRSYFIPCGCVSCHGAIQLDRTVVPPAPSRQPEKPLLNYLDTDHWFDRIRYGEDFAELAAPVIFDPGGFDILRTLNTEIRQQNTRVNPGSPQERAASHWLQLHASNDNYVGDLTARALPPLAGEIPWSASSPSDMRVLGILNHYCFRCHGSVAFDIFDRPSFLSLSTLLVTRLTPRGTLTDPRATMPPDRDMTNSDREALLNYVTTHVGRR